MSVIGLDHLQLAMPRGEEAKARAFYSGVLGLAELAKPAELAGRGGAWFQCGSVQLHLGVEEAFRPAKKAHPAFLVEQLEETTAAVRRAGFEVVEDTSIPRTKRAFTVDPFGNRIELVEANAAA